MNRPKEADIAADEIAALDTGARDISYRIWFGSFVVFFALITLLFYYKVIDSRYAMLVGYLAYMSLACSFFPLPTAWITLWAVMEFQHPVIVAAVGALGTTIANMNDYYLLTFFFKYDAVARIRKKKYYLRAVQWFDRFPFGVLSAASFLPIPVDVVRLLAISRRYRRSRFAAASFAGRFPRYLIFTMLGHELKLGWPVIIAVLCATAAVGLLRIVYKLVGEYSNKRNEDADEEK